jgi:cob(I)alamin adenosyltransferase
VEAAWEEAREAIYSGEWDMVVLDEINYAIGYGMLDPAVVAEALRGRPEMVHVILTGRNAHPAGGAGRHGHRDARGEACLQKGILAQRGIEY